MNSKALPAQIRVGISINCSSAQDSGSLLFHRLRSRKHQRQTQALRKVCLYFYFSYKNRETDCYRTAATSCRLPTDFPGRRLDPGPGYSCTRSRTGAKPRLEYARFLARGLPALGLFFLPNSAISATDHTTVLRRGRSGSAPGCASGSPTGGSCPRRAPVRACAPA